MPRFPVGAIPGENLLLPGKVPVSAKGRGILRVVCMKILIKITCVIKFLCKKIFIIVGQKLTVAIAGKNINDGVFSD